MKSFHHLPGDLEYFADSGFFFIQVECNSTANVPSSVLRTALSAIPFCPQIDVVSKFDDSMIDFHSTDKIESIQWQDLEPRLRIGDCFEIHLRH